MLPFVLVLLGVTSALAAPSVSVSQYSINDIAPPSNNGGFISSYLTDSAFEMIDGGDTNIYIMTIQQILNDMANSNDPIAQALAVSQTIALLGELSYGVPGGSCASANAINSYASGGGAGDYLSAMSSSIDAISQMATNPDSLRYATGPGQGCSANGRTYQFEAAWDAILNSVSPASLPLVNEEYCAAKRLYNAFNARSNNVGAAITAAALPSVVSSFQNALVPAVNFLQAVISGGNPSQAAATLKSSLR